MRLYEQPNGVEFTLVVFRSVITRCVIIRNQSYGLRVEPSSTVQCASIHDNLFRDNVTYEISAPIQALANLVPRSEERRVGKECRYQCYPNRYRTEKRNMTMP